MLDVLDNPSFAAEVTQVFTSCVKGLPVRFGLMHGDFSLGNVFAQDAKVSGVIDWEDVNLQGLPILDAFNYLDSVHRGCGDGVELADTVPLLARAAWPVAEEQKFLEKALADGGYDRTHAKALAILYWIWHVEPQLPFRLSVDRPQIAKRIDKVARALLAVN